MTLEGYNPGLSWAYKAWLKPQDFMFSLFEYHPVVQANEYQNDYNEVYMKDYYGYVSLCMESGTNNYSDCISADGSLATYEWALYAITQHVECGQYEFEWSIRGAT